MSGPGHVPWRREVERHVPPPLPPPHAPVYVVPSGLRMMMLPWMLLRSPWYVPKRNHTRPGLEGAVAVHTVVMCASTRCTTTRRRPSSMLMVLCGRLVPARRMIDQATTRQGSLVGSRCSANVYYVIPKVLSYVLSL
jgi:hypothetical protein